MARRVRCFECNELVQREDLTEVDGHLICPDCLSQYTKCDDCGSLVKNIISTDEDTCVCHDCYENNYGYCTHCEGSYNLDNMTLFNDELWCNDCHDTYIITCEDCGCRIPRGELSDVGQHRYLWVCPDCVSEYHTCTECGNIVDTLRDSMCEYCYENSIDCVDNVIESYSYKPAPIFFGEGDRFYGVELETEPCYDTGGDVNMVREIRDYVSKWAYLKHDGSLCDGGFELVTHPMTLEHHLEKFTPEIFKAIQNADYVSHTNGNCGLHIHISRTAFKSDLAIVKLLEFVYGNYYNIVAKLGRRGSITNYCLENTISSCPMSIERIFRINNEDRYHAVNTKSKDTIELRFFRGTLIRDTFVSALQFADVLVNLANNIEDIDKKIEWSDVLLEIARLGYEELSNEIVKRLDVEALVEEEYEGYKIEVEREKLKTTRVKLEKVEEYEISSSSCNEPASIEWSDGDRFLDSPEALSEFELNYANRYELDRHHAYIPTGTMVQIMPLTMMRAMRRYGRFYPSEMDCFAGEIYKVINCGNFYRLEGCDYYSFDRSSFRVLSEQELIDRGL